MIYEVCPEGDEFESVLADLTYSLTRLERKAAVPWTPMSVINDIESRRAVLLKFGRDSYMVCEPRKGYLDVVIGVSLTGSEPDFIEGAAELYELAINTGFKGILFTTERPGFGRLAKKAGFKPICVNTTYEYVG